MSEPVQNKTGDITIVSVTPKSGPSSEETKDLVSLIRDKADDVRTETGVDVLVTGQTAINIDTADRLSAKLPTYILVVVGLALLLLMLVFRSILVPVKRRRSASSSASPHRSASLSGCSRTAT